MPATAGRTPTAKAFPRRDDDYKQEPGQESLCSSVRMRDPTAGRAIASRTAIVKRRPVQDPIRSWTLCPTPRSLGGLSGYSTKPAGKEQAKTHEESAKCLPSVRAAAWRRRSVLAKPSAERASPMRDTATRRRSNIDTHGYTPTPKEQSENNNPEHHRQDRLRPTSFRRKPESTVPQPPGKPAGRSITRAHWTARPCHSERSEAQGVHSHATTKT